MSKSRSGKTPNANQAAQPITAQNAIIPGKFMESDWNELVEIEDDENFISDIIDEITDSACQHMFNNIVKSRVQPHTVLAVRELLFDIIEWQFLQSDRGEKNTNNKLSWIEDEEPVQCVIDNWAQGAVPVDEVEDVSTLESVSERDEHEEEEEETSTLVAIDSIDVDGDESLHSSIVELREKLSEVTLEDEDGEDRSISVNINSSLDGVVTHVEKMEKNEATAPLHTSSYKSKSKKSGSKKYRPHVGSLPTFEKIPLESVTDLRPKPGTREVAHQSSPLADISGMSVRKQYGRTSGPKEVVYDEKGNVVKVEKLNVANFPKHRVPVKYAIIDPETESDKKLALHLRKPRKTKESKNSVAVKKKIDAMQLLHKVHSVNTLDELLSSESDVNKSFLAYTLQSRSPLPPLMVDSMNLSDGVTIREGGLSKQVIKKMAVDYPGVRSIHPIKSSTTKLLHVNDITTTSPTFRYIANTSDGIAGM